MPVFYIDVYVYALKFKTAIYGCRDDYSKEEIQKIVQQEKESIKKSLDEMGYVNR